MQYKIIIVVVFLVIFASIQYTLNKILFELKQLNKQLRNRSFDDTN